MVSSCPQRLQLAAHVLGAENPAAWKRARYMPALCDELKTIVVVPFEADSVQRLAVLQKECRRRKW